jgi:23S rRNA (pseudouridine1915-N3)-methyltransferase
MKLHVVACGRAGDPAGATLMAEWIERSRSHLPITFERVRDMDALRRRLRRPDGLRVVLDERGREPSTAQLAGWLSGWRDEGRRVVGFFLAGADGFQADDRAVADVVLSLSRLTLPHRLAALVLVEQLYRASTLLRGHPYHRE